MAVGLDDHRVGGSAEIENGVGALRTSDLRAAAAERFLPWRDVALKAAHYRGRACARHRGGDVARHPYIAPALSRSTAARTRSNWPAASRSIGFSPPKSRLRPWIQMSVPSGV